MSSGSESDTSERSSTSVEDVLDKSSDEEDEEDRDDCIEENDSLPVFFVARGSEFLPEGPVTIVEEDRPDGIQLDEYNLANAVTYMVDLVNKGELIVRKMGMVFFIEVRVTGTIFRMPPPPGEDPDTITNAGLFREFILQNGGNFLYEDGFILWVNFRVPGKASQERVFILSEMSLEAMKARS